MVTPAYLDWLKELSGVNVTIFKGDTRVMTTIEKMVSVLWAQSFSHEILSAVLERGEIAFAHNNILGIDYNSGLLAG